MTIQLANLRSRHSALPHARRYRTPLLALVLVLALTVILCAATKAHANGTHAVVVSTTTTISATPASAPLGAPVVLTATVTSTSGTDPDGEVVFVSRTWPASTSNDIDLASQRTLRAVPLQGSGPVRSASLQLRSDRSGRYFVGANYSGDGKNARSDAEAVAVSFYINNTVDPNQARPLPEEVLPHDIVRME